MKLLFNIRCVKSNIAGTPMHIFVTVICYGYLLQELAADTCCSYLPWVCFVYISKPFFCVGKSFFFVSKCFLFETKPFLYVSKTFFIYENVFINSVSFCYCRGSYGPSWFSLSQT